MKSITEAELSLKLIQSKLKFHVIDDIKITENHEFSLDPVHTRSFSLFHLFSTTISDVLHLWGCWMWDLAERSPIPSLIF